METSLAEIFFIVVVLYGLYRLLAPLQRAVERMLLKFLGEKPVVDADIVEPKKKHRKD